MDKPVLYGIIGTLAGVIVGIFVARYAVNSQNYPMMNMMGMGMMGQGGFGSQMMKEEAMMGEPMSMGMDEMEESLAGLKGDEFDKQFIRMMIIHHQGAINMARVVLETTERKELRELAEGIISAQSKEIKMMQGWMRDWFGE